MRKREAAETLILVVVVAHARRPVRIAVAMVPPPLALCSPSAENSAEAQLLQQHGFTVRVAASAAADIVLPSAGGSLAFIVINEEHPVALRTLVLAAKRAEQASKSARRCTILWIIPADVLDVRTSEGLQDICPIGVSVLCCESHDEVVEFMLACSNRSATSQLPSGPTTEERIEAAQHAAIENVSAFLAQLWGVDTHTIDFLCERQSNQLPPPTHIAGCGEVSMARSRSSAHSPAFGSRVLAQACYSSTGFSRSRPNRRGLAAAPSRDRRPAGSESTSHCHRVDPQRRCPHAMTGQI